MKTVGSNDISYDSFIKRFEESRKEADASKKLATIRAGSKRMVTSSSTQSLGSSADKAWETAIFLRVGDAIRRNKMSLKDAFTVFDLNGDGKISKAEFVNVFEKMNLQLTRSDMERLFASVKSAGSNEILYTDFLKKFEVAQSEHHAAVKIQSRYRGYKTRHHQTGSRNRYRRVSTASGTRPTPSSGTDGGGYGLSRISSRASLRGGEGPSSPNNRMSRSTSAVSLKPAGAHIGPERSTNDLHTKVAVLETREANAIRRIELLTAKLQHSVAAQQETEAQLSTLEKRFVEMTEKYHKTRDREVELENKLSGSISMEESDKYIKRLMECTQELVQLRSQVKYHKEISEVAMRQSESVRDTTTRKQEETQNFQQAILNIQSQSADASTIGKLYHKVMLLQWAEKAQKYKLDKARSEIRLLRSDVGRLEEEKESILNELEDTERLFRDQLIKSDKEVKEYRAKVIESLPLDRAEELATTIRELGQKKTMLEESNAKLRAEKAELIGKFEEADSRAKSTQELLDTLRSGTADDLSDKLVELSNRISEVRLSELRALRQTAVSKEKEEYLLRINQTQTETISKLESEVAKWEMQLSQKEQEFRQREDERQKLFFNARKDGFVNGASPLNSREGLPVSAVAAVGGGGNGKGSSALLAVRAQSRNQQLQSEASMAGYLKQIAELNETIASLKDTVKKEQDKVAQKEKVIERFKSLSTAHMHTTGGGGGATRGSMESSMLAMQIAAEDEARKVQDAAQQTVHTLQELLQKKNEQLDRKDDQLRKLREEFLIQKDFDRSEIERLNEELFQMGEKTVRELRGMKYARSISKQGLHDKDGGGAGSHMNAVAAMEHMEQLVDEKDAEIQKLRAEIEGVKKARSLAENRTLEYRNEVDDLRNQLDVERRENASLTVRKELAKVKHLLKLRDKELEALRASLKALKDDLLSAAEQNAQKSAELTEKQLSENMNEKVGDAQLKKAHARINLLTKKMKEANEELISMRQRDTEWREEREKMLKEQSRLASLIGSLEDLRRREREDVAKEMKRSKQGRGVDSEASQFFGKSTPAAGGAAKDFFSSTEEKTTKAEAKDFFGSTVESSRKADFFGETKESKEAKKAESFFESTEKKAAKDFFSASQEKSPKSGSKIESQAASDFFGAGSGVDSAPAKSDFFGEPKQPKPTKTDVASKFFEGEKSKENKKAESFFAKSDSETEGKDEETFFEKSEKEKEKEIKSAKGKQVDFFGTKKPSTAAVTVTSSPAAVTKRSGTTGTGSGTARPASATVSVSRGKEKAREKERVLLSEREQNERESKEREEKKLRDAQMVERWEAEKKLQKKLEALKQQLLEKNKELQQFEKQLSHWKDTAQKLEKEKATLTSRLLHTDKRHQFDSESSHHQVQHYPIVSETVQELKDRLFTVEQERDSLRKKVEIEKESEIRILHQKILTYELTQKRVETENQRIKGELEKVEKQKSTKKYGRGHAGTEEIEREYEKEMRMKLLEDMLEKSQIKERQLEDALMEAENTNLELRFEKENFDVHVNRLNKRIRDLEAYREALGGRSARPNSPLKGITAGTPLVEISENVLKGSDTNRGVNQTPRTPRPTGVISVKSKVTGQSIKEKDLELVVDGLKRLVEKLKTDNEMLRANNSNNQKYMEKVKTEKLLKKRIDELEIELNRFQTKEKAFADYESKLKRFEESNQHLKRELDKETDRANKLKDRVVFLEAEKEFLEQRLEQAADYAELAGRKAEANAIRGLQLAAGSKQIQHERDSAVGELKIQLQQQSIRIQDLESELAERTRTLGVLRMGGRDALSQSQMRELEWLRKRVDELESQRESDIRALEEAEQALEEVSKLQIAHGQNKKDSVGRKDQPIRSSTDPDQSGLIQKLKSEMEALKKENRELKNEILAM
eukprot:GILK01009293.1.p1 GENE.GILK01009293.1~~GILK01009293.1.p1  ORF type:complete len:1971 (-),score=574.63 GILK01009293.1:67-5757(-)